MPAKVVVRNLRKRYGALDAVRDVSFEIEDGEIFGLIGPNGAGKTTTVECLLGLREPDAGTIEICGIDARRRPREVKQKLGAALQTTALQDRITPREALALFAAFYRTRTDAATLLDRFGLAEKADAPFESLSGGQRQRLALALAFVNRPELVVLDEPTSGLDARSRRELHGEIARMKRDGHTVLLTTHYIDEAEALCDRIAVIHRGTIVATGATPEIIARSDASLSIVLTAAQPLAESMFAGIGGIENLVCHGRTARLRSARPNAAIAQLTAALDARGIEIAELHMQRASLEDVFLELTAEEPSLAR